MALLNQKYFPLKVCRVRVIDYHPCKWTWLRFVQLRLAITLVWKVQFQPVKHFYVACNELIHMAHLNQKCFPLKVCRVRIVD